MTTVKEVHLKMNNERAAELKDEMSKLEGELEAAEQRAAEAEAKEDAMYDQFKKDLRQQLDDKYASLSGRGDVSEIETRLYNTHMDQSASLIKLKQDDVMRTNKVIREVSRGITTDWKPVFEYLLAAQFSKAEIAQEVAKIERQNRPLMQAYKALMTWKDLKDESFGLSQLADALRITKKTDLADYVYDVIDSEGNDYMKLKAPGGEKPDGAKGEGDAKASGGSSGGQLDDRKFLQLAKKIGGEWETLATTLGLAEEDITEIREAEGATYQGAFKMLWTWRDRTLELDQDNRQVLTEALKAAGKGDVAELL